MVDHVSVERRSQIMRSIHSKDTSPEIIIRKAAHRLGLRFRLHEKKLPGKPDLVFPRWRVVIFVNGCFWHRHAGCKKSSTPKTNTKYWEDKFLKNQERDKENYNKLESIGWRVIVVWQCQIRSVSEAVALLRKYFCL